MQYVDLDTPGKTRTRCCDGRATAEERERCGRLFVNRRRRLVIVSGRRVARAVLSPLTRIVQTTGKHKQLPRKMRRICHQAARD